jgi:hypothetical protein
MTVKAIDLMMDGPHAGARPTGLRFPRLKTGPALIALTIAPFVMPGVQCRDHSNHDRRKILGKRIARPLSGKLYDAWPCGRSQGDRSGDHSNHDRRKILGDRDATYHWRRLAASGGKIQELWLLDKVQLVK